MLNFLGQLGDVVLVHLLQLIKMALITEEYICLIEDEALELGEVKLSCIATLLQVVGQFAKRSHHNVIALSNTRLREVGHIDVRVFAELGINVGDLG